MTTQHPDDKHLQGYVAARLADGQAKIIEKHLARCPQCSKRVSELENSLQDPLLQNIKAAAALNGDDSSEIVAAVVRSSQMNQSVSNVILPGDILGGNIRLEEKLGRGGMGETWKAYDITAERFVVLKFVPGELQHLKEAMDSVRSSFQKIHALQHQHICPVYSLIDDPKHGLYIVMKYIDGMTLSEYRRRLADKKSKMSSNDIAQILWAVAKGLDYAHERKVIHRDIKPGNIMIGRSDGVQIIDFGLAEEIRTLMSQASDSVAMSSSGTRPYMAPEQWQGRIQDARTDQYALAVTAYELFAGHVPFSGNDVELLKNTVLNDSPESIASLPEYANAALLKALSKKREDRYENCKAFVKALVTKPMATDSVEIEERKYPDGNVSINDLPSDQASGEKAPPVWIPVGFSTSSSTLKPPIITSGSATKKKSLPSWVLPTISALAMLVVCLFFFLGYVMKDKESKPAPKPEKPIAVAKKPEAVPVQEEKSEPDTDGPMKDTEENPGPEKVVEEEPQPMAPPFKSGFKGIIGAVSDGTVQDIEYFLKNGANLNAKSGPEGNTPLHEAARSNSNVEILKYLVSQGADIRAKNKFGRLPEDFAAAANPSIEVLKYFISQGVDINAKNYAGRTMLHEAALFNRNVEVLKYLVSQGADVNAKAYHAWTPLHYAAWDNCNMEVLKYLTSQSADVNAKCNINRTPLHEAARNNRNPEVLKYLISQGGDVNVKDNKGRTPLDLANTEEKKAILRAAMDEKKPPTPSPSGLRDIFEAAHKGTVRDIEYFLKNGADLNAKSGGKGNTPLHEATHYNTNVEVVKYLVSQGADIRAKDNVNRLPQDFAAADNPNIEVLKYYISLGADIHEKNYAGRTMLHEAALFNRNVEVLKYLVSQGADVNAKVDQGWTALHCAVWGNSNIEVLKYLLSQGADVNAKSDSGQTPLYEAAKVNRNVDVLKYLISQGGDVNVKDRNGRTPLDVANSEEKKAILRKAIEPVEAGKLRRQFEEAINQAQTPYREELEKELALAKKQDKLQLVAALEAELKHFDSEDAAELTPFTPEKRSLLNANVRYKKLFETARNTYLKEMDSLAKELVRDARTNDALFVQNEVDRILNRLSERNHLGEQKLSLIRPKRSQFGPVPVIRMTMELHADGKGRCGISRGMSTDSPEPLFPSMSFPLSAFPKAQAFRGQNGMGRVVFDFRDADTKATWDTSGWARTFNHTEIDTGRKTLRFETSKLESGQRGSRALFSLGKFSDLPFRVTIETVVNRKGYCPILYFELTGRQGEYSLFSMWKRPTERLASMHYRRFLPNKSWSDTDMPNIEIGDKQPIWTFFELPKASVENLAHVGYSVEAGNESMNLPPRLDLDVEVVLLDVSGKLKATTGITATKTGEKVMIGNISHQTVAFRAGLKVGDEIVRFNGEKRSTEQIKKILDEVQFGDPIAVAVIRNGEEKVLRFHAE